MNTITMTCWKRPEYLKRALQSIERNQPRRKIEMILIGAEPSVISMGCHSILMDLKSNGLDGVPVVVFHNMERYGCDKNTERVIRSAFASGSDLNIHVEDDVILAPSAIDLVLRSAGILHYESGSGAGCMAMCLHNHNPSPMMPRDSLQMIHEFNPYGWACSRTQWEHFISKEMFTNRWSPDGKLRYGWDWSLNYHCAEAKTHFTLMPFHSQATTIGREDGTYMPPEQWDAQFLQTVAVIEKG